MIPGQDREERFARVIEINRRIRPASKAIVLSSWASGYTTRGAIREDTGLPNGALYPAVTGLIEANILEEGEHGRLDAGQLFWTWADPHNPHNPQQSTLEQVRIPENDSGFRKIIPDTGTPEPDTFRIPENYRFGQHRETPIIPESGTPEPDTFRNPEDHPSKLPDSGKPPHDH